MSTEKSPIGISPSLLQAIASTLKKTSTPIDQPNQALNHLKTEYGTNQVKEQKIFFIPKSSKNLNIDTFPQESKDRQPNNIVILPIGANLTSLPFEILKNFIITDKYDPSKSFEQSSSNGISNNSFTNISNSKEKFLNSVSKNASSNSSNLCPVCMDNISGFHYGIYSCESCKGFFKRSVQNKKVYVCRDMSNCEVTVISRKKCPACRFEKCKKAGMKIEAIRPDRTRGGRSNYDNYPPHISLHKNTPQTQNQLDVFSKDVDHAFSNHKSPTKKYKIQVSEKQKFTLTSSPKSCNHKRVNTISAKDTTTNQQANDKTPSLPKISSCLLKLWAIESSLQNSHSSEDSTCSVQITDTLSLELVLHLADHCLYSIVRWARSVPNFTTLPTEDQILLLQKSWCQLLFLNCCFKSMKSCQGLYLGRHNSQKRTKPKLKYSNKKPKILHDDCNLEDTNNIEVNDDKSKEYYLTDDRASQLGLSKVYNRLYAFSCDLSTLKIDQFEIAALKVLMLVSPDILNLKNEKEIAESQEKLLEDLTRYSSNKYPETPNRIGYILTKLAELYKTCVIAKETLKREVSEKISECSLLFELLKGDEMLH